MKDFLKMTLATVFGLLLFGLISGMLLLGSLGALLALGSSPTTLQANSVLELELNGVVVEREQDDVTAMMSMLDDSQLQLGLDALLAAIDRAATDDNITGIYLNVGALVASPASISEIRQALQTFKESGKFIVAYADNFGNGTYALATVADKVVLNPQGMLGLTGLSMSTLFCKEALDHLGIEMQVFKVGTFKSAVEPYIGMQMSDANRLQMSELSNSIWQTLLDDMAAGRRLDKAQFDSFANEGAFFADPSVAVQRRLADTLAYRSDMKAIIRQFAGDDYHTIDLKAMKNLPDNTPYSADKIAVVYAVGQIDGNGTDAMDSEKIAQTLVDLADDDAVKAVVLRVNSPGGSAYGSEQMWHATQLVKARKPIIVSMGDYAASGGYYMACAADTIVAQPTTITGSIGIFGMLPNVEKLTDKIGVAVDGVKTNDFADFGMPTRPVTAAERALFQQNIERGYELFVRRCADGRHTTTDEIKKIAEGRVWTGSQAKELGLVDVLGGLSTAIDIAADKANLTKYNIKEYPAKRDIFADLLNELSQVGTDRALRQVLGSYAVHADVIQRAVTLRGRQAIMPFRVVCE
ncbi:MAG: signal peptide peptidase SppA [Paludibacteraceae bacterium]